MTRAFALLASLSASACAFSVAGSKGDFEEYKRPSLAKTAAFDFGCPENQLSYAPLGSDYDGYDKVGVSGCSKRATYVYLKGNWIKDSETSASK